MISQNIQTSNLKIIFEPKLSTAYGIPRYVVVDDSGKIIDDAQGCGFKSRGSAGRAIWYKFEGGKEKIENEIREQLKPTITILKPGKLYYLQCPDSTKAEDVLMLINVRFPKKIPGRFEYRFLTLHGEIISFGFRSDNNPYQFEEAEPWK